MALSATSAAGGSQTTTDSPQSNVNGSSFASGQQGSAVQPGTATSVLTSTNGLPLQNSQLSTVSLGSGTTTAKTAAPTKPAHHTGLAGTALSVLLIAVAAVIIWGILRPVKNTSDS